MKNVEFMFVICVLGLSCNAKYFFPSKYTLEWWHQSMFMSDKQDDFYEFAINIEIWYSMTSMLHICFNYLTLHC